MSLAEVFSTAAALVRAERAVRISLALELIEKCCAGGARGFTRIVLCVEGMSADAPS